MNQFPFCTTKLSNTPQTVSWELKKNIHVLYVTEKSMQARQKEITMEFNWGFASGEVTGNVVIVLSLYEFVGLRLAVRSGVILKHL